ncbi:MAG: 16S rRNA (uracil(1498)-N(3))-methyltransferase [Cyclobacteriaceae bacterium]|jgi:16S rRNA (uracil1498-N3)-methyltransferase|nr:16S rRNA (uracil(1498)-N(3))-methyltransferase [Cyclobacteriaceae bacterium]
MFVTAPFFFQADITPQSTELSAEESHHALRVLRLQPGDDIALTNGTGLLVLARIRETSNKQCRVEVLSAQQQTPRPYRIHLAIAPTKNNDRTEWMLEKLTETGVDQVTFVSTQRSEREKINLARFQKVVVGALKQSQQVFLPSIQGPVSFEKILADESGQKFIGHMNAQPPAHLKHVARPRTSYLMLIGPEGDFTEAEVAAAQQAGFTQVSLGPTRLRTETAGWVACQTLHFVNA